MTSEACRQGELAGSIRLLDWADAQDEALELRYAVFVDEQAVPIELERDEHDAVSLHAIAYAPDGAALGTGRLLSDGHIGRMAVSRSVRGRGVGGAILEALVEQARLMGHSQAVLSAQCHAQPFYRAHGFAAQGAVYDDAGIDHILMVRKLE